MNRLCFHKPWKASFGRVRFGWEFSITGYPRFWSTTFLHFFKAFSNTALFLGCLSTIMFNSMVVDQLYYFSSEKKRGGVEGEHIAIYFECRWIDLSLTVSVGSDNESSDNNEESESDDSSTTDSSDSSDDSSSSSSPSSSSGDNSSKSSNSEESDSDNERKSKKQKSKKRWADARRANMRATKHENHTTLPRG